MRLSEKLRAEIEAGHARVMPMQFVRDAEALEARLEAYECLQRSSQTKIEELERDIEKLQRAYQRATRFNPED